MKKLLLAGLCAAAMAAPVVASADDDAVIAARQGYMKLVVMNFGPLGAMVKGAAPYDAAKAQMHADNLLALTTMNIEGLFPAGLDSETMPGKTHALPTVSSNQADFFSKYNDLGTAVDTLAGSAGDGLDALKASFGTVGGACGACHKTYRQSDN